MSGDFFIARPRPPSPAWSFADRRDHRYGVDLFQWTPSDCAQEVFPWQKLIRQTRLYSGA